MNKKTLFSILICATFAAPIYSQRKTMKTTEYAYETYTNDPLKTRIYTLKNGLKVYLTVYKDAPRIQTNIAIKAGSKNDPADATGLAHYLEHMLFKGTDKFGSLDYDKEKLLLDQIELLYEEYRSVDIKDSINREKVWASIDSVSGEAAKFAIANEYDKMLSSIGAKGTNAYTSNEKTVYVNDIPSNQLEKWLKIESERFRNPVFRLFHTELETVYEEKNRGLDSDGRKMFEALLDGLFPQHQYGQQTTIGTIEHLKNPSLVEIRKFYDRYYVPNNMAICLSGDFDYDQTIRMIDQYFGGFPRKEVSKFEVVSETPIVQPIVKEVWGPEAERLYIGFRFPGAADKSILKLRMMDLILSNSVAGLIDLHLNQSQKLINGGSFPVIMKDYSVHGFYGSPRQGQSLEEVKELILAEIEKVKHGEFEDWLLSAIINDLRMQQIKNFENNESRADDFVEAFTLDMPWDVFFQEIDKLSAITKEEIIAFAKENYQDNYVVVYKRNGEDKSVMKVAKPKITPVDVNRTDQSEFLVALTNEKVVEIEPDFLDFSTDMQSLQLQHVPILYKENTENDIFYLNYEIEKGMDNNPKFSLAADYLMYLGTDKFSNAQKMEEFYKIGADMKVICTSEKIIISLTGLNEHFEKAVALLEDVLAHAVADNEALENLKKDMLKKRADAKLNKQIILFKAMGAYAKYGKTSSFTNVLSENELVAVTSAELVNIIHDLTKDEHSILYYGPYSAEQLKEKLTALHPNVTNLNPIPLPKPFNELEIQDNQVFVVDYDMKQTEVLFLAKGNTFSEKDIPIITFHNEYFGGGMSSVVFQELRESKALAYSVYSTYTTPEKRDKSHYSFSYIGTQTDKLKEAMEGMMHLLQEMPQAESNMELAKDGVIQKIRTERITKYGVLSQYQKAKKLGINYDLRKDVFTQTQSFAMSDLVKFHQTYVKKDHYTIMVLGKKDEIDMEVLKQYGKITFLTLEDIFGY